MASTTAPLTVEQFLALPSPEGSRRELVAGEVVDLGSANWIHEDIKGEFILQLAWYLREHRIGRLYSETMY